MKKPLLLFAIVLAASGLLSAQTIGNVSSRASGETIVVSYDLSGASSQPLDVAAFYSVNGGEYQPLKSVTGDVGTGRRLANGKHTLTWNVLKDVSGLDGDVKFRVTATPASGRPTSERPKWENQDFRFEVASCNRTSESVSVMMYMTSLTKDSRITLNANQWSIIYGEGDRYSGWRISTSECPDNCGGAHFDLARNIRTRYTVVFKTDKTIEEVKILKLDTNQFNVQFRDGNRIQCN